MKLLHTSDWHLGLTFQGKSFAEDQKFFIDRICRIAEDEKVNAVLIAGDVFNTSNPGRDARELYDYAMTKLCRELQCRVLVVAGNHDNSSDLESCRHLLSKSGLDVEGTLRREIRKVELGNADIYMLPWFTTDRAKLEFPEYTDKINSLNAAYAVVMKHIRETMRPDRKNIVLSHSFIIGASAAGSESQSMVGSASAVSADLFEGMDYVALGHIHSPCKINEKVRYSGSPMKFSFGREENQIKQVIIIDTEEMSCKEIEIGELHGRRTVRGTFEEICRAEGVLESCRQDYIRAEITDVYVSSESALSIQNVYPNLLEYKGRMYENDDSHVSMTAEELEANADNPYEIFRKYVEDELNCELSDEKLEIFREALKRYEKGEKE